MNTIGRFCKSKQTLYVISTFLFTWMFWIISFTSGSSSLNAIFRIAGSLMPSLMAIIFTNYFYGRKGLKELLKKFTIWKVNIFFVFLYFFIL